MDEKRYRILRFLAGMIEASGWIVLVGGPVMIVVGVSEQVRRMPFGLAQFEFAQLLVFALLVGVLIGLPLIAFGQLIRVFVETEANTRATAEAVAILGRSLRLGTAGGPRGAPDVFDVP